MTDWKPIDGRLEQFTPPMVLVWEEVKRKKTAPARCRLGKGMGMNMKSIVIISAGNRRRCCYRISRSGEHRSTVR
jgi:hypothetical protein